MRNFTNLTSLLIVLFILIRIPLAAQDYWDVVDTITAPQIHPMDEFLGTLAFNDDYVVMGVYSESGLAGAPAESKQFARLFAIEGDTLVLEGYLSSPDFLDSIDSPMYHEKFAENIVMTDSLIAITANSRFLPGRSRYMRTYFYKITGNMQDLILPDTVIDSPISFWQTANELPSYDIRLGHGLFIARREYSFYVYRYNGMQWEFEDALTLPLGNAFRREIEIVNDRTILVQSEEVVNGIGGIDTWGAVEVYHHDGTSWSNTMTISESAENGFTNFGQRIRTQCIADTLQYFLVESDTMTSFYRVDPTTDWVAGNVSAFDHQSFVDFTFSDHLVYAWNHDGEAHFDLDPLLEPGHVWEHLDMAATTIEVPQGTLVSDAIFLEQETFSDSVFQQRFRPPVVDLEARPFALRRIDFTYPGRPEEGIPLMPLSAWPLFGSGNSIGMSANYIYVHAYRSDDIYIYERGGDDQWDVHSVLPNLENCGFQITSTSDSVIAGFTNLRDYRRLQIIERVGSDWSEEPSIYADTTSGPSYWDMRLMGNTLAILHQDEIRVFERPAAGAWDDRQLVATLTPSDGAEFLSMRMSEDYLLVLSRDTVLYGYAKGALWTDKTEDRQDPLIRPKDITDNGRITFVPDPLQNHPAFPLVAELRNNLPTRAQSNAVGTALDKLTTHYHFWFAAFNENEQQLTDPGPGPYAWNFGRRSAMAEDFAMISRPYAKNGPSYKQGDFLIYKRRINQPPVKVDTVLTFEEFRTGTDHSVGYRNFFEDPENDFGIGYLVDELDTLTNLVSPTSTKWNAIISHVNERTHGEGSFIVLAEDRLGKRVMDTVRIRINPRVGRPYMLTKPQVIYGDTMRIKLMRDSLDGTEVAMAMFTVENGSIEDRHGEKISDGAFIPFPEEELFFLPDSAGESSIEFLAAVDESGLYQSDRAVSTIEVGKRQLGYFIGDTTRFYGAPNPTEVRYKYVGLVGEDDETEFRVQPVLSMSVEADSRAKAGSVFSIYLKAPQDFSNKYWLQGTAGRLTILPTPLVCRARDQQIRYLEPLPFLGIECEGFVNEEGQWKLDDRPQISTVATDTSNVGAYEIILSGGSSRDYDLILESGTLEIIKANQFISFPELEMPISSRIGTFQLEATSDVGLPVSFQSSDESILEIEGDVATVVGPGWVNVTAKQEGNHNYLPADPIVQSINIEEIILGNFQKPPFEITIFPNPTTRSIHLQWLRNIGHIKATVTDLSGNQLLGPIKMDTSGNEIDLSGLPVGTYLLTVQAADSQRVFRLQKN